MTMCASSLARNSVALHLCVVAARTALPPLCLQRARARFRPAVNCQFAAGTRALVFLLTPLRVARNSPMRDFPPYSECVVVCVALRHIIDSFGFKWQLLIHKQQPRAPMSMRFTQDANPLSAAIRLLETRVQRGRPKRLWHQDFTDDALIIAPPPAADAYDAYADIRNRPAPVSSARSSAETRHPPAA